MIKKLLSILFILLSVVITNAQNNLKVTIKDNANNEALIGATLLLKGTTNGVSTNAQGFAILKNIPNGEQAIEISYIGYDSKEMKFNFPDDALKSHTIQLSSTDTEIDEIIIEATRGNRTVANLPTRTEVLTDEIDEAASMEAGKIAHLITHSTGIQVQTTAAGSNGAVVRIQGLNGRYTQMLKDGFPLYGGMSGSLDILQIPPLDLRQVEYIKGSASTLYGGGAIAGLINLLSKKADKDETLLHINLSHIGARDFNAFSSKKFGKWGFTNLASMHIHHPYDPDSDGVSDVAKVNKFNFNPKLFYNHSKNTALYFGANISSEHRIGGDMDIIRYNESEGLYFSDKQESDRITTQFSAKHKLKNNNTLTFKNSTSKFTRYININEDILGTAVEFYGEQKNSFTELNYNINKNNQNINIGFNALTDDFKEKKYREGNKKRNQKSNTLGLYINHLLDVNDKLSLESGLRADKVDASSINKNNKEQSFLLPRLSALYKLTPELSVRLGGGMGYRMPTLFNEEAEVYGYKNVEIIDFNNLVAEESYGTNIDFKYQSTFGLDDFLLTFNQMFFYNIIDNPITLNEVDINNLFYEQTVDSLLSKGYESQIKLSVGNFTWFVGYTYTDAYMENGDDKTPLTLTPKHSIKGDLLYVVEDKWRIGWDYDYKSGQFLNNGFKTEKLFSTGVIVERTIDNFVIFLNAENFTDVRQSKVGKVLTNGSPQFTEVWAPLDGYFFNMGLKIKL